MEKLTAERMIELESWLADNRPDNADKLGAMDFFELYYQGEDIMYLMDAFTMPFNDVKIAIIKYDSSHPKMDEHVFLADLQERFCQTSFDMLRRIREVRRIMRYLAKNPMLKIPIREQEIVDDEVWKDLIDQDKKGTISLQGALNYSDRERALINKLRILKTMVEYNGLTLDDLAAKAEKFEDKGNKLQKEK